MLLAGQSISAGRDILTMQADGNLVLYAPGSIPVWASNTAGHGGAQLVMQADGNLVVAAPGGRPLWAAGTGGHSGSVLILRADGDAVLDAPGNVTLWSTNTSKQTYAVTQLAGPRLGTGPVRLPEQHLGPGERLERAGRAPGVRLRDPAGRPGQQDGRRRLRLAHQPADPDPLG